MPSNQNSSSQQKQHQNMRGQTNQDNLSNAAQKMRSGNPQERSEGASELGKAGGQQSHKNDNRSSGSGSSGSR